MVHVADLFYGVISFTIERVETFESKLYKALKIGCKPSYSGGLDCFTLLVFIAQTFSVCLTS